MIYRNVDDYIEKIINIYEPIKNNERDFYQILARLVESIAKCSQYVNKSNEVEISKQLPTLFAWYSSLIGKAISNDIRLSEILWRKYPNCCPYCLKQPCICPRNKKSLNDNSKELQELSKSNSSIKPETFQDWQEMFAKIYPRNPQGYDQKSNFIHLIEEVGEVAEAYRLKYFHPDNLNNELADVMTWIFGIANLIDAKAQDDPKSYGFSKYVLEEKVQEKYINGCPSCESETCKCIIRDVEEKISESYPLYPSEVYNKLDSLFGQMISFQDTILTDLKLFSEEKGLAITKDNVEIIAAEFVDISKKKRWYQNISSSGIAEGSIVNAISMLAQTIIGG